MKENVLLRVCLNILKALFQFSYMIVCFTSFLFFFKLDEFQVMVLSYGFIIKRLRRKQVRTTQSLSKTTNKNQKKKSTKSDKDRKRVTMMCATLVISFFLCWVLFHSYHLAKLIGIRVKSRNVSFYFCYTQFRS